MFLKLYVYSKTRHHALSKLWTLGSWYNWICWHHGHQGQMTELLKRAHFELVIRKLKKCKVEYQIKGKPPTLVFWSKHRIPPVPIIISFSESKYEGLYMYVIFSKTNASFQISSRTKTLSIFKHSFQTQLLKLFVLNNWAITNEGHKNSSAFNTFSTLILELTR